MQNVYRTKRTSKSSKTKKLLLAKEYLNNICLNSSSSPSSPSSYSNYSNDNYANDINLKHLLFINIKSSKSEQSELFNKYKQIILKENPNKNKLTQFIHNEFNNNNKQNNQFTASQCNNTLKYESIFCKLKNCRSIFKSFLWTSVFG